MQFRVDTGAVVGTAQKFGTIVGEFENHLQVVTSEINNLNGLWTGAAATQFDELAAKWQSDANVITQDLQQIQARLNSAARAYEETETATKNAFQG